MSRLNERLDNLESESIYIIRKVLNNFLNSAILFSGGKDSTVLLHLYLKAIYPKRPTIPLVHIDTCDNFSEVLDFRDRLAKTYNFDLKIYPIDQNQGLDNFEFNRNRAQSKTLLNAISQNKFEVCFGGARRDEEKSRAKERVFSRRQANIGWNPYNQEAEFGRHINLILKNSESLRVFPLSNWSELDVWEYIQREQIDLPRLYFSHMREVILVNECYRVVGENTDLGKVKTEKKLK